MQSSYKEMLEKQHENYLDRLEDLEQMAKFAERAKNLSEFLGEATLQESYSARLTKDGAEKEAPRVVLSTIHQSKGLEWDAVFILRVASGSFPNEYAVRDEAEFEEERRLFYVASTRAKKQLFINYPLMAGTESAYLMQPSPFVQELPESLFKEVDDSEIQYVDAESPDDGDKPAWAREFLSKIDDL